MGVKYTIAYLQKVNTGFSFLNFFRSNEKTKCEKCKNHAVLVATDQEDEDNQINLCLECYNFYSVENLLSYQKHGPRRI